MCDGAVFVVGFGWGRVCGLCAGLHAWRNVECVGVEGAPMRRPVQVMTGVMCVGAGWGFGQGRWARVEMDGLVERSAC